LRDTAEIETTFSAASGATESHVVALRFRCLGHGARVKTIFSAISGAETAISKDSE
jgi:hypothetical protein